MTEANLSGLGEKERAQYAQILRANLSVITPENTAHVLGIPQNRAKLFLSILAKKGWVSRVKRGVYVPISVQSDRVNVMVDEPWVLAQEIFEPCYIGGWSAAEHWGLTEQIFNSVMVFTAKQVHKRESHLNGATFTIKTVKKERFFGLKNIWQGDKKVLISDPTRTVVDAFNDPAVIGGIRMAMDILSNYFRSEHKNQDTLFEYAKQLKNGAFFKRIGFCLEKERLCDSTYLEKCRSQIKSGYSQLDPSVKGTRLVTSWGLWISKEWEGSHD